MYENTQWKHVQYCMFLDGFFTSKTAVEYQS